MGADRLPGTGAADGVRVFPGNIPVGADVRPKTVGKGACALFFAALRTAGTGRI